MGRRKQLAFIIFLPRHFGAVAFLLTTVIGFNIIDSNTNQPRSIISRLILFLYYLFVILFTALTIALSEDFAMLLLIPTP